MRHAGRIVADVLALMEEELKPGVTTAQLDAIAEDYIRKAGARPSFKGYRGFPGEHLRLDRRRGRPRHPGRPGHRRRPGRIGRCRRDLAGLPRRRRPDVLRRHSAGGRGPAHRDDASGADGGHRRRGAGRTHRRRLRGGGGRGRRGRCDIVRPFVGHGIGTQDARGSAGPQLPDRAPRRGAGDRGSAWPSSRCWPSAAPTCETLADGWTVVTTRPFTGRPLRAHDRGDGERAGRS